MPDQSPRVPPDPPVEVVRSARRRKTVTAYRQGGKVVVLLPARMSRADEVRWVETMLRRLDARERQHRPASDLALARRAARLAGRYLGPAAQPASVRWVSNMRRRYGSCTIQDRSIRLSARLLDYPEWVRDYVLVHELAHLLVPDHSARFWELVARYPRAERARGFLIAKGLEDAD